MFGCGAGFGPRRLDRCGAFFEGSHTRGVSTGEQGFGAASKWSGATRLVDELGCELDQRREVGAGRLVFIVRPVLHRDARATQKRVRPQKPKSLFIDHVLEKRGPGCSASVSLAL